MQGPPHPIPLSTTPPTPTMPPLPLLGRLHPTEYLALALSLLLASTTLLRTLLPPPLLHLLSHLLSLPRRAPDSAAPDPAAPIARAPDFAALCRLAGYDAQEHVVRTRDGYLLGVHRVVRRGAAPAARPRVAYLHHGLLMNSEVWVCATARARSLPFVLVEAGYDVWLGNNRGNKYSKKHERVPPSSRRFWDFSLDQFALHDIPDTLAYVLAATGARSLSYVGFSQGSAQAFAALALLPALNARVDVFVALAPALAPPGLARGVVARAVSAQPAVLFLVFGRRALLGSAAVWAAVLRPGVFVWVIDRALGALFGWRTRNISRAQKRAAYPHLYSYTSTKTVVHWFQIMRARRFQVFDDESPLALAAERAYQVAKFPTRNIATPILLLYGGEDCLVDIELMLRELPARSVEAREIPAYEHLDFLWAEDVDRLVFPHVLDALDRYAPAVETPAGAPCAPSAERMRRAPGPGADEDGRGMESEDDGDDGGVDVDGDEKQPNGWSTGVEGEKRPNGWSSGVESDEKRPDEWGTGVEALERVGG